MNCIRISIKEINELDDDLQQILNELWGENPNKNLEYFNMKIKLMVIQELRNIQR